MNLLLSLLSALTITLSVFLLHQIKSLPTPVLEPAPIPTPAILGGTARTIFTLPVTPNNLITGDFFSYLEPIRASAANSNLSEYVVLVTGDVMPARAVNLKALSKNNFNYPYERTHDFLNSADLVFINLETPLTKNCQPTLVGMIFCADERSVEGLIYAGVDVANLANNHVGNYGLLGVKNTISILQKNNISTTGHGSPAIVKVRDKKFGFLGYSAVGGYSPGLAAADQIVIRSDIKKLKRQVDFVIIAFHWGVEYTHKANEIQRSLAHLAIDAGADLVVGHHPHWVQGVEVYKNKFIAYSHGNFVFDQMWSRETREGVVGKYTFDQTGLVNVGFIPVIIEDYSQPRFASKTEAEKILTSMKQTSQ